MAIGFVVRQRGDGAAVDQLGTAGLLGSVARCGHRTPHHQCAQKRFGHQATAQALEHHGDVKARAAKATHVFREQGADGAEFGKLLPALRRITWLAVRAVVAEFDAVLLGHETVEGIRQHAAVFGVFKIHRINLTGPKSSWR